MRIGSVKFDIPFIKPSFPNSSEVADDYDAIVASNWFTNFGPYENKFREEVAHYIGNVEVCTTANATLALDIAIAGLLSKSESANRVITQSFTFAAAAERLIANGYTPVFIDIDENLQPDIRQAEELLKGNRSTTSGILIANTFGVGNPRIEDWERLARDHNLPLIIDSAAGLGSSYNQNEKIGSRGDCEVFSLHATKPFAVGEGGLISSKNKDFVKACRELSNFGFGSDRQVQRIGTNAKLQELNCAIGLRQLDKYEQRLQNRRKTLDEYKKGLQEQGFEFQTNDDLSTVAFASVIAPDPETANHALNRLHEQSVEARRYYSPLHLHKELARRCEVAATLSNTENIAARVLSLPVHDAMSDDLINRVIEPIADII